MCALPLPCWSYDVFSRLNWLAIVGATFAAFVAGGLWFGPKTLFPVWWRAMGRDPNEKPAAGMNMDVVFGSTFVAAFVQAVTVAGSRPRLHVNGLHRRLYTRFSRILPAAQADEVQDLRVPGIGFSAIGWRVCTCRLNELLSPIPASAL